MKNITKLTLMTIFAMSAGYFKSTLAVPAALIAEQSYRTVEQQESDAQVAYWKETLNGIQYWQTVHLKDIKEPSDLAGQVVNTMDFIMKTKETLHNSKLLSLASNFTDQLEQIHRDQIILYEELLKAKAKLAAADAETARLAQSAGPTLSVMPTVRLAVMPPVIQLVEATPGSQKIFNNSKTPTNIITLTFYDANRNQLTSSPEVWYGGGSTTIPGNAKFISGTYKDSNAEHTVIKVLDMVAIDPTKEYSLTDPNSLTNVSAPWIVGNYVAPVVAPQGNNKKGTKCKRDNDCQSNNCKKDNWRAGQKFCK